MFWNILPFSDGFGHEDALISDYLGDGGVWNLPPWFREDYMYFASRIGSVIILDLDSCSF